ncbi:unnamed protein product [Trichobilharzia regenti]|nr:unnamed protein product [Trichobilharzia regenti]
MLSATSPGPSWRRLGKTNTTVNNGRNDLRNKLNLTIRTPDARSLLHNRVRQRNSKFRDARNLLRRRNVARPRRNPRVPFFLPVRTSYVVDSLDFVSLRDSISSQFGTIVVSQYRLLVLIPWNAWL